MESSAAWNKPDIRALEQQDAREILRMRVTALPSKCCLRHCYGRPHSGCLQGKPSPLLSLYFFLIYLLFIISFVFAVFKGLQEESLQKKENSVLTRKHMINVLPPVWQLNEGPCRKMGSSLWLKISSNRWKGSAFHLSLPVRACGVVTTLLHWGFLKNEHWVTKLPENCVHFAECGGQAFLKSRSSGGSSGRDPSKSLHGWRTDNGVFDATLCCLVSCKHTGLESGIGKIDAEWITKGTSRFISQATVFGIKWQNNTLIVHNHTWYVQ